MIKNNHEYIFSTLRSCLAAMMTNKTWKDTTANLTASLQNSIDGVAVFRTLATVFLQSVSCFETSEGPY